MSSYQVRQAQIAQKAARRDAHRELIILALGDPSLLTCWEPPHTSMTAIRRQQVLFTNPIVTLGVRLQARRPERSRAPGHRLP
ncbi:DUF6082 family protein [Streptomyces sp. NPDC014846]|uniref:DUF6082 family protein n=1 Tax=Streptomyces sp. NPDC014846 TaxID=3364922 RepID=UPI0036F744C9